MMSEFGFFPEDYSAADQVVFWPEQVLPVRVFMSMQTQWRVGFAGLVGLDYSALPAVYQGLQIPAEEIPEVFAEFQVLELTYLEIKRRPSE